MAKYTLVFFLTRAHFSFCRTNFLSLCEVAVVSNAILTLSKVLFLQYDIQTFKLIDGV